MGKFNFVKLEPEYPEAVIREGLKRRFMDRGDPGSAELPTDLKENPLAERLLNEGSEADIKIQYPEPLENEGEVCPHYDSKKCEPTLKITRKAVGQERFADMTMQWCPCEFHGCFAYQFLEVGGGLYALEGLFEGNLNRRGGSE